MKQEALFRQLLNVLPVRLIRGHMYLLTSDIAHMTDEELAALCSAGQQLPAKLRYRVHRKHKSEAGKRLSVVRVILEAAGFSKVTSEYQSGLQHTRRFWLGNEALGPALQALGARITSGQPKETSVDPTSPLLQ